jgi:zinc transport system substrate-binding protein
MRWLRLVLAVGLVIALSACSEQQGSRTVVASFYPLAWAAERIAGPGWEVIDLTPPGVEAHDVELTLEDRAAIEDADVIVYLGDIGFQPQVEGAVRDADGLIVDVSRLLPDERLRRDPHFWLDPALMSAVPLGTVGALRRVTHVGEATVQAARQDLDGLHLRYQRFLNDCRYQAMIVPHEAFGYIADRFGLRQFGLTGVTPESEPTAARLAEARQLIDDGEAGAVFFEPGGETQRAIDNLAADAGVPALPLSTLESEPPSGDYISVMEDNLRSLRKGLGCE